MRTSTFVPMNVPIIAGMLISAPTAMNVVRWQFVNQTYNAGLNYGNRNASSEQTPLDLFKAYSVAVTSAITVGVSMRVAADILLKGRTGALVAFS